MSLLNMNLSGKLKVGNIETKNLFNKNDYTQQYYVAFNTTNLVNGKTYTFSSNLPVYWFKIASGHDASSIAEKTDFTNGFQSFTFTMSGNSTQYIYISTTPSFDSPKNMFDYDNYNFQIEKGTIATDYSEYLNTDILHQQLNNCSKTEQVIGRWTDGKPLYSKWFEKTITSHGTQSIESLSNIKDNNGNTISFNTVWINNYFSKNANNSIIGAYWTGSNDMQRMWIEGMSYIAWQGGTTYPTVPATLWYELRYTKTTD